MKAIFRWLFQEEWEKFEKEMRDQEWNHYVQHRVELERGNKAIEYLKERYEQEPIFRNGQWEINP